jgi:transcriptional regulator with XRE-family HTH domain
VSARHLSARQLAELCAELGSPSLTRSAIAKLEAGQRETLTDDEIAHLAQALGVSSSDLIEGPRALSGTPTPPPVFVGRSHEIAELARYLSAPSEEPIIFITGTFGSGKTALAAMLLKYLQAKNRASYAALWITLGRDITPVALASKINDVTALVTGARPNFVDPETAGMALANAIQGTPTVVVLDDVWNSEQLLPFRGMGDNVALVVTTRNRSALPAHAKGLVVDRLPRSDGIRLLTAGLTDVSPATAELGWELTGGLPLLLTMVNRVARTEQAAGLNGDSALREVLDSLRSHGPTTLDSAEAAQRSRAVSATIRASIEILDEDAKARFFELAVFEAGPVPLHLVERYWAMTGDLSADQSRALCRKLFDLSLLQAYTRAPNRIELHPIIRTYLKSELGNGVISQHALRFIQSIRALVSSEDGSSVWWELQPSEGYLWAWLPTYLYAAGLYEELISTVLNPSWISSKLRILDVARVREDLALVDAYDPRAVQTAAKKNPNLFSSLAGEPNDVIRT